MDENRWQSQSLFTISISRKFLLYCCISTLTIFSFESLHPKNNRTAVIITGELRSGNISFSSKVLYSHTEKSNYFNDTDPRTPIQTQLEYLIEPLALFGGVDLFLYIPASVGCHDDISRDYIWDGDPLTYLPHPGDIAPCELYSSHSIFHRPNESITGPRNRVFCLIECPQKLDNIFIRSRPDWQAFSEYNSDAREPFLQQEYGKYRANLASKGYATLRQQPYAYKIRLRPDIAIISPFPSLDSLLFVDVIKNERIVYYPCYKVFGMSAHDSFNVGVAEDMDNVLDRYIDLITKPILSSSNKLTWISEYNLKDTLRMRYNISLVDHQEILMTKIRVRNKDHRPAHKIIPMRGAQWILMP